MMVLKLSKPRVARCQQHPSLTHRHAQSLSKHLYRAGYSDVYEQFDEQSMVSLSTTHRVPLLFLFKLFIDSFGLCPRRLAQVTSLLTRMASDGEIPAMPTPTYGKILSLADQVHP